MVLLFKVPPWFAIRVSSEKYKLFHEYFGYFAKFFFRDHFASFSHFVRSQKIQKFLEIKKCRNFAKKIKIMQNFAKNKTHFQKGIHPRAQMMDYNKM